MNWATCSAQTANQIINVAVQFCKVSNKTFTRFDCKSSVISFWNNILCPPRRELKSATKAPCPFKAEQTPERYNEHSRPFNMVPPRSPPPPPTSELYSLISHEKTRMLSFLPRQSQISWQAELIPRPPNCSRMEMLSTYLHRDGSVTFPLNLLWKLRTHCGPFL